MKISLTGRPGRIVEKGNVIVTTMQQNKAPNLPKGLPTPPEKPTIYVIYIGQKQWKKIKEAIQDPNDTLIVEGYPFFDKEVNLFSVFATRTTTKALEGKQRPKGEGATSETSSGEDDEAVEDVDE